MNTPGLLIDQQIDIFEQHFSDRIIAIAEELACQFEHNCGPCRESGFFILFGVASYFETISQFINGTKSDNPGKSFCHGFREVYLGTTLTDREIGKVYDWLRNGMYHSSMPKHSSPLSRDFDRAITVQPYGLEINPTILVADVRGHFNYYVGRLRNPAEIDLRDNFKSLISAFDVDYFEGPCTTSTQSKPTTPNPMDEMRRLGRCSGNDCDDS